MDSRPVVGDRARDLVGHAVWEHGLDLNGVAAGAPGLLGYWSGWQTRFVLGRLVCLGDARQAPLQVHAGLDLTHELAG